MKRHITILLTILLLTGCTSDTISPAPVADEFILTQAALPEMAPYPDRLTYMENGDDEGLAAAWDAWRVNETIRSNLPPDYMDGMMESTRATARVFLTDKSENTVYSPLNTCLALGILAETTTGEGQEQILSVLGSPDVETMRKRINGLWRASYRDDGRTTAILSASLWLDRDISYKKETLQTIGGAYYASSYQGEMGDRAYDTAMQSWLHEKTGGMLADAVQDVRMEDTTVLTMLSTVYYQSKWEKPFAEEQSRDGVFHGTAGDSTCTYLHQTDEWGTYYAHADFGAIYRRIEGSGKMWFILPDADGSVDTVLRGEDMYTLLTDYDQWIDQTSLQIRQSIPRFDISEELDMTPGLEQLGITIPFDKDTADYTPLTDMDEVFLSKAEQAARVSIDEKGITAVSFVEMVLEWETEPPQEKMDFVLDRPFVFVITGEDDMPLFIGVVYQP